MRGETSFVAIEGGLSAGRMMMTACVVSSPCSWTSSGGEQAVSVTCLVRGLALDPASPSLPGLLAKEIFFHVVYGRGWFHAYGSLSTLSLWVHIYLYFLHVWLHVLSSGFLEVKEFFLLFLCIRACHPLHYANFVILERVLLVSPIYVLWIFSMVDSLFLSFFMSYLVGF